jgi:hypothetical protein
MVEPPRHARGYDPIGHRGVPAALKLVWDYDSIVLAGQIGPVGSDSLGSLWCKPAVMAALPPQCQAAEA